VDAFISYSAADRKWAEKLNQALTASGISTWLDRERVFPAATWRPAIEEAIQAADNTIVLIGPSQKPSLLERHEWQAVVEAIWANTGKRLIPFLLEDAKLPAFVRSTASADEPIAAIRARNPRRDWNRAVSDLIQVLQGKVDLRDRGELISTIKEDRSERRERLSYIRKVAHSFPF
jgi:hypothetical protein